MAGLQDIATGWPAGDLGRVPYALYTDAEVYERELERIFRGPAWNYACLAVEIPQPGDFVTTVLGGKSVIVCRDKEGAVNAFLNRCAHRGVKFCHQRHGNQAVFTCPYHRWNYDQAGRLRGVPFARGVKERGGMPADFERSRYDLPRLAVHERHGVIFASFGAEPAPFEDYLGPANLHYFDRVFDGRELAVLGYSRQRIPANWKLMFENIKDPYHASLLHVFLVTFGLFRADQESQVRVDATGRHGLLISTRGEQKASEHTRDMQTLREDFRLEDPRLLQPVREFPGNATVVMQTIWPNLIVQQQSNTLALRQIQPCGPDAFDLHWTFFGYADDSEEMRLKRLRQANLMSSAGLVSGDDSEVLKMAQDGVRQNPREEAVLLMGGTGTADEDHMVTEAPIRAFYRHYREVMEL